MTRITPQPSKEQAQALVRFISQHGLTWKEALRNRWWSSNFSDSPEADRAYLQQLRNNFGPEWLNKTKPSKLRAIAEGK
jgi:hypothetical protein